MQGKRYNKIHAPTGLPANPIPFNERERERERSLLTINR